MATEDVVPFGLPPSDAIRHLRRKVNIPTGPWYEMVGEAHARAFTVAGATKVELLEDLRKAITTALEEGRSLQAFRQDFGRIVNEHGWAYNGAPGWRSDVMLNTNMRTAYAAGRWQQLQEVKDTRPFWEYRHSPESVHPRVVHKGWHGMVLPADDPFWKTHFPPNGWGCNCTAVALSQGDMDRLGKAVGTAPKIEYDMQRVAGSWVKVPKGLDYGWDYNVGEGDSRARMANLYMDKLTNVHPRIAAEALKADGPKILPQAAQAFRGWLDGLRDGQIKAQGAIRVVSAFSPGVVKALEARGLAPESAAIGLEDHNALRLLSQAAKGKEVAWDVLRTLPENLRNLRAVVLDRGRQQVLLVLPAEEGAKAGEAAVLRVGMPGLGVKGEVATRRPSDILLGGRVALADLADRGRYELLEGEL